MLIYIMYIFILIIFLIIIIHIIINKFSNKTLFKKKVNSKKLGSKKTIFPEYSENITENKIIETNEKEDLLDNIETNLLQDLMLDN